MKKLFNTILAVSFFVGTVGLVILSADNADAKSKQAIVKTTKKAQKAKKGGDIPYFPNGDPNSPYYNPNDDGCGGGGDDSSSPVYNDDSNSGGSGPWYNDGGSSGPWYSDGGSGGGSSLF